MGQTVEPVSDSLRVPVRDFVDGVTPALTELGSAEPRADVVAEAYEIVSAFVDADGTHTDEELWALIGAFSGLMERCRTTLEGTGVAIAEYDSLLERCLQRDARSLVYAVAEAYCDPGHPC